MTFQTSNIVFILIAWNARMSWYTKHDYNTKHVCYGSTSVIMRSSRRCKPLSPSGVKVLRPVSWTIRQMSCIFHQHSKSYKFPIGINRYAYEVKEKSYKKCFSFTEYIFIPANDLHRFFMHINKIKQIFEGVLVCLYARKKNTRIFF